MVSVTLSIPEKVKHKMEHFSEMNWSAFVRKCIEKKTSELTWRERMLKKLEEEKELTAWAVKAQRTLRKDRVKELKKKGLL